MRARTGEQKKNLADYPYTLLLYILCMRDATCVRTFRKLKKIKYLRMKNSQDRARSNARVDTRKDNISVRLRTRNTRTR